MENQLFRANYQINNITIPWGTTLENSALLLKSLKQFHSYDGGPNFRFKCDEVFGLKTTEVEIRAPFLDRPVLNVSYNLSPVINNFPAEVHEPYLEQIESVLGAADIRENDFLKPHTNNPSGSDQVVFSASWIKDDIRIGLSVYGGIRNDENGPTAALIYLKWINELEAAKPYVKDRREIEAYLASIQDEIVLIGRFELHTEQVPCYMPHYEYENPHLALESPELRTAQLSLYNRFLVQPANFLKDNLKSNEIRFYKIPVPGKWLVSNHCDAILIDADDLESIEIWDMLPVRKPGSYHILLKELQILDSRKEPAVIFELIALIEKEIGISIEVKQENDY